MRGGVTFSALLHLAVLVVIVVGLPEFSRDLEVSPAIPVEIVNIDDITRPKPVEKPQPKVEQPEEPQEIPEAPKPPPRQVTPAPPPPPEPVKQVARAIEPPAPAPEPEPEPEPLPLPPEPKVEPEPEPEPEKVEKPKPEPQAPRPERKPRPKPKKVAKKEPEKKEPEVDPLDQIMLNVDRLKKELPNQPQQPAEEPKPQQTANLSSVPMTAGEIDAVRQQINPCWNPNLGAPNAEDHFVEVRIFLNQDGSLLRPPQVLNLSSISRDGFHRAAAEAAVRAINRCTPLQRLPAKKYAVWREIVLEFDPSESLGQ